MSEMYKVLGEKNYKVLLADVTCADPVAVSCAPGNGVLTAGTVLYRNENGFYAPATATEAVDTNMLVILGENVDTTGVTSEDGVVAETAAAYRAGRFARSAVKLANDTDVTAAAELALRKMGIYLEAVNGDADFSNVVAEEENEEENNAEE